MFQRRRKQHQETDGSGKHFFKILVGDFTSKLCIPPAFAKYIEVDKCADATINSHMDGAWTVKLHRNNNLLFFKTGWRQFVKRHTLQYGEFLLFKYYGDLKFDVRIFGRSGCQRVSAHVAKSCKMHKMKEEPAELCGSSKHPINDSSNSRATRRNKSADYQQIVCPDDDSMGIFNHYYASKQNRATKEEREKTLQVVQTLNLSRPHFAITMTNSNIIKELCIPKGFVQAFPLESGSVITLKSPKGSSWKARFSMCRGYGRFVGGWRAFAAAHNLVVGDICVFELTEIKELVMNVHILRVADATNHTCSMHKKNVPFK